jgi:transcription antitermination protein NusB
MRNLNDPRHIARILSVMDLYEHFFGKDYSDLGEMSSEDLELGNYSKKLRETIVPGVKEKFEEIDKLINEHSEPVKTSDLDLLILQIIRIAVWEGFISNSVPPKVAVDEAIELARDFGLDTEAKKVGGILGKIFEKLSKEVVSNKE